MHEVNPEKSRLRSELNPSFDSTNRSNKFQAPVERLVRSDTARTRSGVNACPAHQDAPPATCRRAGAATTGGVWTRKASAPPNTAIVAKRPSSTRTATANSATRPAKRAPAPERTIASPVKNLYSFKRNGACTSATTVITRWPNLPDPSASLVCTPAKPASLDSTAPRAKTDCNCRAESAGPLARRGEFIYIFAKLFDLEMNRWRIWILNFHC